jgi:hypothetical protein
VDTLRTRESCETPGFDPVREFHWVEDVFLPDPIRSDITLPDPLAETFPINIEKRRDFSGAEKRLPFAKSADNGIGVGRTRSPSDVSYRRGVLRVGLEWIPKHENRQKATLSL